MNSPIRLRRNTDGRVALLADPEDPNPWLVSGTRSSLARILWAEEADVSGDGWFELFVAELPEPDGYGDDRRPYWWTKTLGMVQILSDGTSRDGTPITGEGLLEDPVQLCNEALKMLAAVAACEKYRADREATT